jgi:MYXO-CTERM domain-containing protein
VINSADGANGNPPKDNMGNAGTLIMHAFSPRESKRINVTMRAARYSIGHSPHPDIRAWLRHVDGLYGEQTAWNRDPSNINLLGGRVQARMEVDVLSPREWQFNGGADQLEGWNSCGPGHTGLGTNADNTAMIPKGAEAAHCAVSPSWTSVDSSKYDQMVIRLSATGPGGGLTLGWKADGQSFDAARQATFTPTLGAATQTYVLDLAQTGQWAGTVDGLKLSWAPESFDAIAVDAIFFQDSAGQTTSSATEDFVDQAPVEFDDLGTDPGSPDAGLGDVGGKDAGFFDGGDGGFSDADGWSAADSGSDATNQGGDETGDETGVADGPTSMGGGCGCSATSSGATGGFIPGSLAAMLLLGAGAFSRRRSA